MIIFALNSSVFDNEMNENMKGNMTYVIIDLHEVDYIYSAFMRMVIKIVKTLGKEILQFQMVSHQ